MSDNPPLDLRALEVKANITVEPGLIIPVTKRDVLDLIALLREALGFAYHKELCPALSPYKDGDEPYACGCGRDALFDKVTGWEKP